jgi:hypothetical protein
MPGADPVTIADRYISDLRRSEPAWVPAELSSGEATPLGNGFVVRYRQQHLGIPVLAGDLVLRISSEGQVVRLARDVVPTDALNKVNPIPSLSVEDAQRSVQSVLVSSERQSLPSTIRADDWRTSRRRSIWQQSSTQSISSMRIAEKSSVVSSSSSS